ncbi:chemotaxis response regulator protein-glutamate methylesterase [Ferrovum sp.]|uniref:protein-glutamate methylesterase/protein-glutamine glutaminase n=1 Tax=Ferrovum sp. TaxID=2609467 RepID=UPI002637192C|nr:chemotaxis response regulator protein-glutamate methylesterase [Ferrovum sp.]
MRDGTSTVNGLRKIRVLIIDDSALIRAILTEVVNSFPDLEAVGAAAHPLQARDMIKALNPDVLTLDVEMPKMDGLTFLERLMRLRPMPVLMISSLTERGSEVALNALELGAVDFIAKPKLDVASGLQGYAEDIASKIRMAFHSRASNHLQGESRVSPVCHSGKFSTIEKIVLVGSSTGGTEALKVFLEPMPTDAPAILIAQHMPEAFTKSFAVRLNGLCRMNVKEAEDGERVLPGHVYVAPGHSHLRVARNGVGYMLRLGGDAPVNHHRPSVDVLFQSAVQSVGANGLVVMLTGMGRDGAQGMLQMRQTGAYTIAQDEATSVVYGMPRAAVEVGAVDEILPLGAIAGRVLERLRGQIR